MIWVLAPTAGEARALARVAPLAAAAPWSLHRIAMGPARAADATRALLARGRPSAVLLVGLAGGLDPGLAIGDVVVPTQHHPLAGDDLGHPVAMTSALTERLRQALDGAGISHRCGPFVTSPRVLADPREKRAFGARGCLAVEMEGLAVAAVCHDHALPCASVRVVLDPVEHRLPDLAGAVDERGEVRLRLLVRQLLRRPGLVADIPPMVRAARTANAILASVVARVAPELVVK